jgi:release factor glutamine methyltransferase
LLSDLFERIDGEYDIIVSNPPYIARHDFSGLQKEVLMEPHAALDGGEDGLDYYRRIFKEAKPHLTKGGYVIAEIGYGQLSDIRNIVRSSGGFDLKEIRKDQNGIDRVIITQWTS